MSSAKLTSELTAPELSAAHQDEDAVLAARLEQLVINEKWILFGQQMRAACQDELDANYARSSWLHGHATHEPPREFEIDAEVMRRWNEMTLIQQKNWGESVGSSSLVTDAPAPKKPKKKSYFGAKKRKTGYQCFVSENYDSVREELSNWQSIPKEKIPSHEVFSELALRWRMEDGKVQEQAWKNFASRKGPLPERKTFVQRPARKGNSVSREASVVPDVQFDDEAVSTAIALDLTPATQCVFEGIKALKQQEAEARAETAAVKQQLAAAQAEAAGLKQRLEESAVQKQQLEEYFVQHNLRQTLEDVMNAVVEKRPKYPLVFMAAQLYYKELGVMIPSPEAGFDVMN